MNVNDCDKLAQRFKITSLPTILFMRGGGGESNILAEGRIEGAGPQMLAHFKYCMDSRWPPALMSLRAA